MLVIGPAAGTVYSRPVQTEAFEAENTVSGVSTLQPSGTKDLVSYNITANVALTIGLPLVLVPYKVIIIRLKNASGGALTTTPAFVAGYHLTGAVAAIATGQHTNIAVYYDPVANLLYELYRSVGITT